MAKHKVTRVPDGDDIIRYVSPSRIRRDENSKPVGILYAAFQLRPGEKYLSAAWVDFYPGKRQDRLMAVMAAYDASPLHVKPSGGFAVGSVGAIKNAAQAYGQSIRVVCEPTRGLKSYVAVRQFDDQEYELLTLLAEEAWAELVTMP